MPDTPAPLAPGATIGILGGGQLGRMLATAAASRPAFTAPARPMASVPTGTPAGICTIDSRLSMPFSALLSTGTPNTGSGVIAAVMPGRCAAPPAPAMMTFRPRSRAAAAYS